MLLFQVVFFTACSDIKHIEIERDGSVTFAYENDIDEENRDFLEYDFNSVNDIEYYDYSAQEINTEIYNFFVMMPIDRKSVV